MHPRAHRVVIFDCQLQPDINLCMAPSRSARVKTLVMVTQLDQRQGSGLTSRLLDKLNVLNVKATNNGSAKLIASTQTTNTSRV